MIQTLHDKRIQIWVLRGVRSVNEDYNNVRDEAGMPWEVFPIIASSTSASERVSLQFSLLCMTIWSRRMPVDGQLSHGSPGEVQSCDRQPPNGSTSSHLGCPHIQGTRRSPGFSAPHGYEREDAEQ